MNFTSDNCAGVHPSVMRALAEANEGHAPAYGRDDLTRAAEDRLREVLDAPEAVVMLTATGTAANAIACGLLSPPWGRIFCHEDAHIETSECGAPEMFTGGAKLTLLPHDGGVLDLDALERSVAFWQSEGLNAGLPAVISVANCTEWGRALSAEDMAALGAVARQHQLALHVDGARFANAVAATGSSAALLSHRGGADALCFGGTKNGAMGVEAVVAFDGDAADRLAYLRKRSGHLLSKHRYLAAQMLALLEDDLWLDLAAHANAMAADLAARMAGLEGFDLLQPVESNQLFATIPTEAHERARSAGARYHLWPSLGDDGEDRVTVRLVTSWNSTEAGNRALIAAMTAA